MKKDIPIPYDRRIFRKDYADGNSVLFIKNVQTTDFGTYTCLAVNDEGEQDLHIELSGKFFQSKYSVEFAILLCLFIIPIKTANVSCSNRQLVKIPELPQI